VAGEDEIIRNLLAWRDRSVASFRIGMEGGARLIEADLAQTTTYRGMSGATRASTIAYVATANDTNDAEIQAAYNTAAGHLQGFTGHAGRPHLGRVAGPGQADVWIVGTVPTDYIDDLELDNAGEKAFLGDTVLQDAPQAFAAVVALWREAFS